MPYSERTWNFEFLNLMYKNADMRKGVVTQSVTTEILMDCGNFMLTALNFSIICWLKFIYHGTFTYITKIIHSNAHLNPFYGIFSEHPNILQKFKTFNFRIPNKRVRFLMSLKVIWWKVREYEFICNLYGIKIFARKKYLNLKTIKSEYELKYFKHQPSQNFWRFCSFRKISFLWQTSHRIGR